MRAARISPSTAPAPAPGSMEDFQARALARLQREATAADRRLAKAAARLLAAAGGAR